MYATAKTGQTFARETIRDTIAGARPEDLSLLKWRGRPRKVPAGGLGCDHRSTRPRQDLHVGGGWRSLPLPARARGASLRRPGRWEGKRYGETCEGVRIRRSCASGRFHW